MWNFELNTTSIKLYAIAHYKNRKSTWSEFFLDMKLLGSVNKLIHANKKLTCINQIINAIVRLGNAFKKESLGRLLFCVSEPDTRSDLKTFLLYLSRLPENILEFDINAIEINQNLLDKLNAL